MSSKKTPKDASEPRTLRGDDTQAVEPGLNQFQSLGLSFPKSSTGTNEQDTLAYLFDLDNDNLFEEFSIELDQNTQGEVDAPSQTEPLESIAPEQEKSQAIIQEVSSEQDTVAKRQNAVANHSIPKPHQGGALIQNSAVAAGSQQPVQKGNSNAHTRKANDSPIDTSQNATPEKQRIQSNGLVHAPPDESGGKKKRKQVHFKADLVDIRTFYKEDDALSNHFHKKSPEKEVRPILKGRTKRRRLASLAKAASPARTKVTTVNVPIPPQSFDMEDSGGFLGEHLVDLDCTLQTMLSETNSLVKRLHRLCQRVH